MIQIIFTDLDGTLLDDKYSFREAIPALKLVKKKNIPLIFCTSKTESEIEIYIKEVKIKHPFIVENGGAIFIPKNYFDFKFSYNKINNNYFIIELGTPYRVLKKLVDKIKKQIKSEIIDFSRMDVKLIAKETGLRLNEAKLAKKRKYSFQYKIRNGNIREVIREIKKYKLNYTINYTKGKKYHYIMGKNDKAKAVEILAGFYKRKYKNIFTVGLGNSFNDLSMLKVVDKAFLIKNKDDYDKDLKRIKNIEKINGIASKGWNKAIMRLLKNDN